MSSRSLLALTYNDNSVLEQYHSSLGFFLLHHHALLPLPRLSSSSRDKKTSERKKATTKIKKGERNPDSSWDTRTDGLSDASSYGTEERKEEQEEQEKEEEKKKKEDVDEERNLVDCLSREEYQAFRREVIELIVHTDMSKHFSLLALFKVKRQTGALDFV